MFQISKQINFFFQWENFFFNFYPQFPLKNKKRWVITSLFLIFGCSFLFSLFLSISWNRRISQKNLDRISCSTLWESLSDKIFLFLLPFDNESHASVYTATVHISFKFDSVFLFFFHHPIELIESFWMSQKVRKISSYTGVWTNTLSRFYKLLWNRQKYKDESGKY